jgi:hypothetical protein
MILNLNNYNTIILFLLHKLFSIKGEKRRTPLKTC